MDVEPLVVRCRGESLDFDAVRGVFREAGLTPDESVSWDPGRERMIYERDGALGRVRAVVPESEGHDLRLRANPLTRLDWLRAVVIFERAFAASGLAWATTRRGYRPNCSGERSVVAADLHTVGTVAYFDSDTADRVGRAALTSVSALAIREDDEGRVTLLNALHADSDRLVTIQNGLGATGRAPLTHSLGTYREHHDREPGHTRPSFEEGPVEFAAPPPESSGGDVALLDHLGIWDREDVREELWEHSEETLEALVPLLSDDREAVRRKATWTLWYGARGNADVDVATHLVARLTDESAGVRSLAIDGIRRAGECPDAVEAEPVELVRSMALDHDDPDLRETAVRCLGTLADATHASTVVDTYREVIETGDEQAVREAALDGVGSFTDDDRVPHALDLLFELLDRDDADTKRAAAAEIPTPPTAKSWGSKDKRKIERLTDAAERYEPTVQRALEAEEPAVRALGVRLAVLYRDDRARQALNEASVDPDPTVRRAAARAISLVSTPTSTDSLANMLDDESGTVRLAAATLLADYADAKPAAVAPHLDSLVDALDDDSDEVVEWITRALRALGDPAATDALVALLDDDRDIVRMHAVRALDDVGDERALDPLETVAREDPDRGTRRLARDAIDAIEGRIE